MPLQGLSTSAEAQDLQSFTLLAAATADGAGTPSEVGGMNGAQMAEVVNGGTGSSTLFIEGSYDGASWYAIGYQQVDNTANPSRAVAGISVTNASKHIYQILDLYRFVRARLSGTAGSVSVTVKLVAVPQ